jgi:hypothetical protein
MVGLIVPRIRSRMGVLEQALLLLPTSLWMDYCIHKSF